MGNAPRKKKVGRPIGYRKANPASEALPRVRVTPEQLNDYKKCAEKAGQSLSQWIRDCLDKGANK